MARRFILTKFIEENDNWNSIATEFARNHTYFSCQLERCPNTQRLHIQAYCETSTPRKFEYYGTRGWHAVKVGKDNGASNYGCKERTRVEGPLEFGEKKKEAKDGGEAEKLRWKNAREAASEGRWKDIDDDIFIRHYSSLKRIHCDFQTKEVLEWPYEFHPWQYQLLARLGVIEDRKIIWIYDEIGKSGKTKFAKWMSSMPGHLYATIGKKEDILHVVRDENLVIFDIARSEVEYLNYATLEKIKDGAWLDGKYEGAKILRRNECNLVVFSNSLPEYSKLSVDRWEIYQLINNNMVYIP